MQKKIAVLIRGRQDEALRMGVGITLEDDIIDIFVLDRKIEMSEKNDRNLFTAQQLDQKVYTNHSENTKIKLTNGEIEMELLDNKAIAKKLLEYDHILPY